MLNKLMLVPMAFLLVMIIFIAVDSGERYTAESDNYSTGEITINGTEGDYSLGNADSIQIDFWQVAFATALLATAIGAGIVSGLNIFGSGLSDTSQKLIFNGLLFGGIWAALSVVAFDLIFDNVYMAVLWMGLSVIYVIGMGAHMGDSL